MKPKVMTGQGKTIRLSPEDNVMENDKTQPRR
jgi:hypothetical protein